MARSMTGYGRGEKIENGYRFVVEAKAVNHRHFDLLIRASRDLLPLEDIIRRIMQEKISRGRVEVFVNLESTRENRKEVVIDEDLAASYFQALGKLRSTLNLPEGDLTAIELSRFPEIFHVEKTTIDLDILSPVLEGAAKNAVSELFRHRVEEGYRLELDITMRLDNLKQINKRIKEKGPLFLDEYQRKLSSRLDELHNDKEYDKQRFFMEVAIYAERCNIDEEIVRMDSHLQAFGKELVKDEVMGRKLDFLLQEMNREINTIASKSSDLEISQLVVEAKSEIEKIREQVQNIE
ncbi:MAG: YicC/YloC family endoribonuclease [Bacillota bacterium]|nr:YicC/YloC family endoribonuclease [Bacillota bacterium]